MTIKELKILIKAAEGLGHRDIELVIADGRDGIDSWPLAEAFLINTGNQHDPHVCLAVSRCNGNV